LVHLVIRLYIDSVREWMGDRFYKARQQALAEVREYATVVLQLAAITLNAGL